MSSQSTSKTASGDRTQTSGKSIASDFSDGRTTQKRKRRTGGQRSQKGGSRSGGLSDVDYAKLWFKKFAGFHGVKQLEHWRFTLDQMIAFMRDEKSGGAPTWKRLKMAESIDLYQKTFMTRVAVDLTTICSTLQTHAEKERAMERGVLAVCWRC